MADQETKIKGVAATDVPKLEMFTRYIPKREIYSNSGMKEETTHICLTIVHYQAIKGRNETAESATNIVRCVLDLKAQDGVTLPEDPQRWPKVISVLQTSFQRLRM